MPKRWKDFEDAVPFVTAMENGVECIVTRDMSGFEAADIPCISPADFVSGFIRGEGIIPCCLQRGILFVVGGKPP